MSRLIDTLFLTSSERILSISGDAFSRLTPRLVNSFPYSLAAWQDRKPAAEQLEWCFQSMLFKLLAVTSLLGLFPHFPAVF